MTTNAINTIISMADKKYDQEILDTLTDAILSGTGMIIDMYDTVNIKPYEDLLTEDANYFTIMNFLYRLLPDQDESHTILLVNNANLIKELGVTDMLIYDMYTKLGVRDFLVFRSASMKDLAGTDVKKRLYDETDSKFVYNLGRPISEHLAVTYRDLRHTSEDTEFVDNWLNDVTYTDAKRAIIIPDMEASLSADPDVVRNFVKECTSKGCIVVNQIVTFIIPESTKPTDKGYGLMI